MKELELHLSTEEINRTLTALGQMPYLEVHNLIHKIQSQASIQMQGKNNKPKKAEQLNSISKS